MTLYVAKRVTTKGVRWHARFQHSRVNGGKVVHLGVYDSEKGAKLRLEAAKREMELTGRAPTRFIETPAAAPATTVAATADAWFGTLHDLSPSTLKGYGLVIRRLPPWLASMSPTSVTHDDIVTFANELTKRYKRSTAARHLGVLRLILDHAERRPNPEHHMRVRLARAQRKTYRLPTRAEIAELHRVMPSRVPLMILLEHTGLRVHEAANLRWSDIDQKRQRFLVQQSKTAAGRRWVERLPGTPPFPKRDGQDADALVFTHPAPSSLTGMLRVSHQRHGTFLMSAHEFRHLHASRLLHEGTLSPAQISARLGHASPALTLDVYTHVAPPED